MSVTVSATVTVSLSLSVTVSLSLSLSVTVSLSLSVTPTLSPTVPGPPAPLLPRSPASERRTGQPHPLLRFTFHVSRFTNGRAGAAATSDTTPRPGWAPP